MAPRFDNLDQDSLSLLKLVAYLAPGNISGDLFQSLHENRVSDSYDLGFCTDVTRFNTALSKLRANNIMNIDHESISIEMESVLQERFKSTLSLRDRQDAFNKASAFLLRVFSDRRSTGAPQYESWDGFKKHSENLEELRDHYLDERRLSSDFKGCLEFSQIIIRYQRFMFIWADLRSIDDWCRFNYSALNTLEECPQQRNLKAIVLADLAKVSDMRGYTDQAIRLNRKVYHMRVLEQPRRKDLISKAASNLGYCYNSANQHGTALECLTKARRWWASHARDFNLSVQCPAELLNNAARCLIYLDEFGAAEQILEASIGMVQGERMKDYSTLAKGYFVLGTLKHKQGSPGEAKKIFEKAQRAWLMSEFTYLDPFHAACLHKFAMCCVDQGKFRAAVDYFTEALQITDYHARSMPVDHARSLFGISELLRRDGEDSAYAADANAMEQDADNFFRKRRPNDLLADCENFVSIIWR